MIATKSIHRIVAFLDSEPFLAQAAQWSGLALQFGTGPALIINGFVNQSGMPLIMTLPTCCVFVFRSRLFVKKQIPSLSEVAGLVVWGTLLAQSIAFGAGLL